MGSWHKLQRLSWSERRWLVQALLLLPLIALALRLVGFRRLQSALTRLAPLNESIAGGQVENRVPQARVMARIVKAAAAHGPYRANCLKQSLALWWLLRHQGIEGDLRIGVRKEEGCLKAHAWVEFMGHALNDSADVHQRFTAFDRAILPMKAL